MVSSNQSNKAKQCSAFAASFDGGRSSGVAKHPTSSKLVDRQCCKGNTPTAVSLWWSRRKCRFKCWLKWFLCRCRRRRRLVNMLVTTLILLMLPCFSAKCLRAPALKPTGVMLSMRAVFFLLNRASGLSKGASPP